MPRHPRLKTLHELSMDSIFDHMEAIWCRHFLKEMSQTHWLFVEGPFDTIHPQMCDFLIQRLQKKRLLKRHHIYLMVNPGLKSLTLENSVDVNTNLVLQLIAVRCRTLNCLNLNRSKFRADHFQDVCEYAGHSLTELRLSKCQISNTEVAVIGSRCPNIRVLDLSDIAKVSDPGVRTLFLKVDLTGIFDDTFGVCKKISSLNVSGTLVTEHCAQEILSNLSETLVDFDFPFSFVAALALVSSGKFSGLLKIRKLHLDLISYEDDDGRPPIDVAVEFVSQFCPNVQNIYMIYDSSSVCCNIIAPLLSSPRRVQEIFFQHNNDQLQGPTPPFGFQNVLFSQGSNLRNVTLVGVGEISLTNFLIFCPLLESLHLDFCFFSQASEEITSNAPCLLKYFRLHCVTSDEAILSSPSQTELAFLMNKANLLKSIDITGCDQLTDFVFSDSWGSTPSSEHCPMKFPHLQKFRLVECNHVSWDSLSPITLGDNDLQDLQLDRCKNIHRSHVEKYKKNIEQKKFIVNITWR